MTRRQRTNNIGHNTMMESNIEASVFIVTLTLRHVKGCKLDIGNVPQPDRDILQNVPLDETFGPLLVVVLPQETSIMTSSSKIDEKRQPYKLSNLDLVTESLTLMAGTRRLLFFNILYRW